MDPYIIVRDQVEASLQSASNLHSSYKRILATVPKSSQATSEELSWSKEELEEVLASLENDLEELELSVDTVSQDPARFGLNRSEVRQRRAFVNRVKDEITSIRRTVTDRIPGSTTNYASQSPGFGANSSSYPPSSPIEDETPSTYEGQQQQFLYETQDTILEGVGRTVSTLKQQAGLMGSEVLHQVGMLEDLESGVQNSQSRLDRANRKLNRFIEQNKNSKSSWAIFLLTIVLSFLLLLIILI